MRDFREKTLAALSNTALEMHVTAWLATFPRGGAELGVSRDYLLQMVQKANLTVDDVESLISMKREFPISIPEIRKLLVRGLKMEEVVGLYEARQVISSSLSGDRNSPPSFGQLIRLVERFPSLSYDPEILGETVVEASNRIADIFPWVKYPGRAMVLLCEAADYYQLADVGAALQAMKKRRRMHDRPTQVDDDEEEGL